MHKSHPPPLVARRPCGPQTDCERIWCEYCTSSCKCASQLLLGPRTCVFYFLFTPYLLLSVTPSSNSFTPLFPLFCCCYYRYYCYHCLLIGVNFVASYSPLLKIGWFTLCCCLCFRLTGCWNRWPILDILISTRSL